MTTQLNYQIIKNNTYNSNEVIFNEKPSRQVLDSLKALGLRWNPRKALWYGFATAEEIAKAITGQAVETITKAAKPEPQKINFLEGTENIKRLTFEEYKKISPYSENWAHTYSNNRSIKIDNDFIERRAKEDYNNYLIYQYGDKYLMINRPKVDGCMYYDDETPAPEETEKNLIFYNLRNNKHILKSKYDSNINNYYLCYQFNNTYYKYNKDFIYLSFDRSFNSYKTYKDLDIEEGNFYKDATPQEIKDICKLYGYINIDFIQRIKKYFKRYGCTTYGYWANR